jgi:hypothetical protein
VREAVLATRGRVFPDLPLHWLVPFELLTIIGMLSMFVESVFHREQWQRWGAYMEHKTAWDIVAGRHFPPMRDNAGEGT